MNKNRILFSLVICIIVLAYPIYMSTDYISKKIDEDKYVKLGFAVENNTLYNLKLVEKKIDRRVDIFHIFQKINETPKLNTIQNALDEGYTVLLTVEPWEGWNINTTKYVPSALLNGSIDADIDRWAISLNSLEFKKGKIVVRTMHEMNGNWYPWSAYSKETNYPEDSRDAYIHIVKRFRNVSDRLLFMWGLNYRGNRFVENKGTEYFYETDKINPGDQYYDMIGISGYNRISKIHSWKTFSELYGPIYLNIINVTNRSIWMAEISSVSEGGNKAEWISDTFYQTAHNYPRIDAIVWFDENKIFQDHIVDWAFDSTEESEIAFKKSVEYENMKRG